MIQIKFPRRFRPALSILTLAFLTSLSACGGAGGGSGDEAAAGTGSGGLSAVTSVPSAGLGTACGGKQDPDQLCVALHYVAYGRDDGSATLERSEVGAIVASINQIWSQCGISFQAERYEAVDPASRGLRYNPYDFSELDEIRRTLGDGSRFLVVPTGPWDRTGSIGNHPAIAWTESPGAGVYGVILDQQVANDVNVTAHELGHYMGLDHTSGDSDLMNAVVDGRSQSISSYQCDVARETLHAQWPRMLR